MTRLLILAALLVLLLCPGPAQAESHRVDDSASQVLGGLVRMKWETAAPQPGRANMLVGQVTILVRLDMSPWKGRSGRLYHQLEKQPSPVLASWTTRGALLAGELRDGDRTLVYAGLVTTDRMEDTFVLTLRADADLMSRPELLEFSFVFEPEGS